MHGLRVANAPASYIPIRHTFTCEPAPYHISFLSPRPATPPSRRPVNRSACHCAPNSPHAPLPTQHTYSACCRYHASCRGLSITHDRLCMPKTSSRDPPPSPREPYHPYRLGALGGHAYLVAWAYRYPEIDSARTRDPAAAYERPAAFRHCRTTQNDPGREPGFTVHPGPTVAVHPSPFSVVASTTTGAGSEMVSPSAEMSAPVPGVEEAPGAFVRHGAERRARSGNDRGAHVSTLPLRLLAR